MLCQKGGLGVKKEKIRETGSNQIIGASNEQI
jgi:hypothetical protein